MRSEVSQQRLSQRCGIRVERRRNCRFLAQSEEVAAVQSSKRSWIFAGGIPVPLVAGMDELRVAVARKVGNHR